VKEVTDELKQKALDKKLKFSLNVDEGNYKTKLDTDKMRQIIGNVIDNSIKYTPAGSVDVDLSTADKKMLLKVSDTGIGIPKGGIEKLFKKFSRLENANNGNITGTGLGLYLTKEVVKAHGGKVWVESEGENKGSQFFIELNAS